MRKILSSFLISMCLILPVFSAAQAQQVSTKQQIIQSQPKINQNYSSMSEADKASIKALVEKSVSLLPSEEETELRYLISKASSSMDAMSDTEVSRFLELQTKAMKLLPEDEYKKLLNYGSKVSE